MRGTDDYLYLFPHIRFGNLKPFFQHAYSLILELFCCRALWLQKQRIVLDMRSRSCLHMARISPWENPYKISMVFAAKAGEALGIL